MGLPGEILEMREKRVCPRRELAKLIGTWEDWGVRLRPPNLVIATTLIYIVHVQRRDNQY